MRRKISGLHLALFELDERVFRRLHGRRRERLDRAMIRITHLGDPLGWAALAAGLCAGGREGRRIARAVLPAAAGAVAVSYALKVTIGRPRPRVGLGNIEALVRDPDRYSFPSAHTSSSVAVAVCAMLESPVLGWPLAVLAAAISFSRIYVGVHYPLDVVAGAAVGAAVGALEPIWGPLAAANARNGARAIRGVWLRGRAVDQGLPLADFPPLRAWADR